MWLALAAMTLAAAIGLTSSLWQFSSSVSRLSACLAGCLQLEGRRPHVDNRRYVSNSRPDRQLDPSAGDAVLALA
jgi:hypothetical protein